MEAEVMKRRLFSSLRQQLIHEIFFVHNVSEPYLKPEKDLQVVDFQYKKETYQLVLNGKIILKTNRSEKEIKSFNDLVKGLLQTNKKAVA